MRRRELIRFIGGAAVIWPVVGRAQQRVIPVVGVLCAGTAQALERYLASFREGMRQLGYVEGSNIRFEFRFADGYLDRLPDLANELVRLNPRVIVSTPLPAHLAARKATSTIPIVMATGADPVSFGLVASLSHPGGNVTGLANFAEMLASKQIDLLREMLPRLARFGSLVNVSNPLHLPQLRTPTRPAFCSCLWRLVTPTSSIQRLRRLARSALKRCSSRLTQPFIRDVGRLPTSRQRHVCLRFMAIANMWRLVGS